MLLAYCEVCFCLKMLIFPVCFRKGKILPNSLLPTNGTQRWGGAFSWNVQHLPTILVMIDEEKNGDVMIISSTKPSVGAPRTAGPGEQPLPSGRLHSVKPQLLSSSPTSPQPTATEQRQKPTLLHSEPQILASTNKWGATATLGQ